MPHPEWNVMSDEQKMEFLYNWCCQMSEVIQELRTTTQTLMDKVISSRHRSQRGRRLQGKNKQEGSGRKGVLGLPWSMKVHPASGRVPGLRSRLDIDTWTFVLLEGANG